jgi:hypothetical protein
VRTASDVADHSRRQVLLSLLGAVLVAGFAFILGPVSAYAGVPSDPAQHGYIGLCDGSGHNVTSGNIHSSPFVWKAVGSQPPPSAYTGKGENAVLNIYQLRSNVPAAEWSGEQLTAATFYSHPSQPTAQATTVDLSLADIIADYPLMDGGRYELRMYFGKSNYGDYSDTYPATFIQVTGSTWRVIAGGTVSCGSARGVSDEVLTGGIPKTDANPRNLHTTPPVPGGSAPAGGQRSTGSRNGPSQPSETAAAVGPGGSGSNAPGVGAAAADPSDPASTSALPWIGVGAGFLLLFGGALWWARGPHGRSINGREYPTS